MHWIQATSANIRLLLEQCDIPYKVMPFDEKLYQECVDDGRQRGYPMDGAQIRTYLQVGATYAATAAYDIPENYLQELPDLYQFNDRFIKGEPQTNGILGAYADIVRRTPDLYHPVAAQLITTSTLNFVTATLLEHETKAMKISCAALQYPTYQRTLSGEAEAYSFLVFWKEVPLNNYIQSIPEITVFIQNVNDALSFYKEELIGDPTNQISTLAARTQKSKLEVLAELTETTISVYKRIVKILEESPEACEVFKNFAAGYVYFHTSSTRYRMNELGL